VLWALGSMLRATQTVDMVTSLKQNYGRVEVAVLNVDLLPNMIDTVVIGNRLYSLLIQVEGRMKNGEEEVQMELDDEANDAADGHNNSSESSEKNNRGTENKDKPEGSGHKNGNSSGAKQVNGSSKERAAVPVEYQFLVKIPW
jgi:hypothetical protein